MFLTEPIPYHSGCRRGRTDIIESESPCPEELKDKIEVPYGYGNAEVHIRGAVRIGGEAEPEEKVRRTGTLLLPVQMCAAPPRFQGKIYREEVCALKDIAFLDTLKFVVCIAAGTGSRSFGS